MVFSYYVFDIQMKEGMLDNLLNSMTQVGQETRILTNYFIPDHKKKILIQQNLEEYKRNLLQKKKEREQSKLIVDNLIKNEEELDNIFLNEISNELNKDIHPKRE